jgi:hypothetical protein
MMPKASWCVPAGKFLFDACAAPDVDVLHRRAADPLEETAGVSGLVGCIEELVFQGRGAAVDDQDLRRGIPLQSEAVGIIALAEGGGGQVSTFVIDGQFLDPGCNGLGQVFDGRRMADEERGKERIRDEQHRAPADADDVGDGSVAGHERHLAEDVPRFEHGDTSADAKVIGGRHFGLPGNQHPKEAALLAEFDNSLVRLDGCQRGPGD